MDIKKKLSLSPRNRSKKRLIKTNKTIFKLDNNNNNNEFNSSTSLLNSLSYNHNETLAKLNCSQNDNNENKFESHQANNIFLIKLLNDIKY